MSETYLQEILEEKDSLDPNRFVHAIRLLEDEVLRVTTNNSESGPNPQSSRGLDGGPDSPGNKKPKYRSYAGGVVTEEIVKLSEKVVVPVKEYPKFNFVGKLLGPRGNTLKRLQAATQTRMSVLGRGSTRDKDKEEELRKSAEAKYEHLNDPLHVLIEVEAPKSEAHARLAAALAEIKKYMVPENDDIRQDQMREMAMLNGLNQNPDPAGPLPGTHYIGGRGRGGMQAPIVRVGIPPPGAIILNGQSAMAVRGRVPRVLSRGRGMRPIAIPRHAAPAPESYAAYDTYDTTYDAAYEGYPETGNAVYLEYAQEYPPASASRMDSYPRSPKKAGVGRRGEKRPPIARSFGAKKYRADPYAEVSYPTQQSDPYRAAAMH